MIGETLAALFIVAGTIGTIGFASIFGDEQESKTNTQTKEGCAK